MSYAFTFDASACSGCKSCQEACKDKNGLGAGLLWRRVIEVSGGEWHRAAEAWENSVFAYNLSMACNHCVHPKCAGVCPTDAYDVRPDGIVLIDASKCMGCGYCAWACPYGAPQYDARRGIMTKCDFCYDYLEAGMPPSCVAACPLRALDYGMTEELGALYGKIVLWQLAASEHPFPLPDHSRTEPHLCIKPHAAMDNLLPKVVSNREEILPPGSLENTQGRVAMHELPLVTFSLLAQMAVGMAVGSLALSQIPRAVLLPIGILLGSGGLISFLHLGRKRNAWRSVIHLKKSWLSREVLMAGLFGTAWAYTAGSAWLLKATPHPWPMAILGLGLIYCMARVYHLRSVPGWNSWRTLASFLLSAAVLGALGLHLSSPQMRWMVVAGLGMLAEVGLLLPINQTHGIAGRLRMALLAMGLSGILLTASLPTVGKAWPAILITLAALAAEAIGRWQFYARRVPFPILADRT